MGMKHQEHFRLTQEARELLKLLAEKLGVTKTSAVEIAIRKLAEQEKIKKTVSHKKLVQELSETYLKGEA